MDAAVRVFARKGFHASRVGDIAEEAGVAHGLLYHYFRSKDEVLDTVFLEVWELLAADTDRIEHAEVPLREQLRRFARIYLGSWLVTPDVITVLVREIARSAAGRAHIDAVGVIFRSLQRMITAAQERGEVRADCDTQLAAWVFYGALEEILTGWVLGQLAAKEEDVERAVVTVVDVAYAGLAA